MLSRLFSSVKFCTDYPGECPASGPSRVALTVSRPGATHRGQSLRQCLNHTDFRHNDAAKLAFDRRCPTSAISLPFQSVMNSWRSAGRCSPGLHGGKFGQIFAARRLLQIRTAHFATQRETRGLAISNEAGVLVATPESWLIRSPPCRVTEGWMATFVRFVV